MVVQDSSSSEGPFSSRAWATPASISSSPSVAPSCGSSRLTTNRVTIPAAHGHAVPLRIEHPEHGLGTLNHQQPHIGHPRIGLFLGQVVGDGTGHAPLGIVDHQLAGHGVLRARLCQVGVRLNPLQLRVTVQSLPGPDGGAISFTVSSIELVFVLVSPRACHVPQTQAAGPLQPSCGQLIGSRAGRPPPPRTHACPGPDTHRGARGARAGPAQGLGRSSTPPLTTSTLRTTIVPPRQSPAPARSSGRTTPEPRAGGIEQHWAPRLDLAQ